MNTQRYYVPEEFCPECRSNGKPYERLVALLFGADKVIWICRNWSTCVWPYVGGPDVLKRHIVPRQTVDPTLLGRYRPLIDGQPAELDPSFRPTVAPALKVVQQQISRPVYVNTEQTVAAPSSSGFADWHMDYDSQSGNEILSNTLTIPSTISTFTEAREEPVATAIKANPTQNKTDKVKIAPDGKPRASISFAAGALNNVLLNHVRQQAPLNPTALQTSVPTTSASMVVPAIPNSKPKKLMDKTAISEGPTAVAFPAFGSTDEASTSLSAPPSASVASLVKRKLKGIRLDY